MNRFTPRAQDRCARLALALFLGLALLPSASAQTFDSGSDGSDGELDLTEPGTIEFDPLAFDPRLDPDEDGVYHFTTITVEEGVTVRLSARLLTGPVFWLASGAVQIEGKLDLDGGGGQGVSLAGVPAISIPGAGGFAGGLRQGSGFGPTGGSGPRGISQSCVLQPAGGGGGGANSFLVPLFGGSGGGSNGGGGGAGGGALLIASSVGIVIDGAISANGGVGGSGSAGGGGGAIRLVGPSISGGGQISASGSGSGNPTCQRPGGSGVGRIRLEAFEHGFTGSSAPTAIRRSPIALFLPSAPSPMVRAVSVGGVPVPILPGGSFAMPDVTVMQATTVPVEIEARNVPPGNIVKLHVFSEDRADQVIDSTPLEGSDLLSTATAIVDLPTGHSRAFVRVAFEPL